MPPVGTRAGISTKGGSHRSFLLLLGSFISYVREIFWKSNISYVCLSGGKRCLFFGKFYVRTKWMIPLVKMKLTFKFSWPIDHGLLMSQACRVKSLSPVLYYHFSLHRNSYLFCIYFSVHLKINEKYFSIKCSPVVEISTLTF